MKTKTWVVMAMVMTSVLAFSGAGAAGSCTATVGDGCFNDCDAGDELRITVQTWAAESVTAQYSCGGLTLECTYTSIAGESKTCSSLPLRTPFDGTDAEHDNCVIITASASATATCSNHA